jgi:hypothetical protein
MSRRQTARQKHIIIANKSVENVSDFKYLGTMKR